jgi:hypothetical protein
MTLWCVEIDWFDDRMKMPQNATGGCMFYCPTAVVLMVAVTVAAKWFPFGCGFVEGQ